MWARWLVVVIITRAPPGRRVATAGGVAVVTKGKFTTKEATASAVAVRGVLAAAVVVLGVAPQTPAVFTEDPEVEGRDAVVPEVEGAPPLQAARAGKRLPPAVQEHIASGGDLNIHP